MQGRDFENIFKTKCIVERLKCLQHEQFGARKIYKKGTLVNQLKRAPFDFIVQTEFSTAFIDTKVRSYKHDYITPSFITSCESTKYQFEVFKTKLNGIRGFVVYFSNQDIVKFFHVDKISLEEKTRGLSLGSLNEFSPRSLFGS